jgi:chromosome segregation protein
VEAQAQELKGTRITKLVMEGFKSFAKRTELVFDKKFSVVLGPNGSGKSNVADAICFVLGKSSSKQLRAEKSAHLIYNGGKTKQPANSAEVSIFFDNEQKFFPFEEKEIKVTRAVRKDGASKYKINNGTVTRQEVLELLRTAKINPDGYNIIMQGDITRLVEMNPVDRRQIVEEIAGIGVYEEKKLQAIKELAKVDQRLNEAEIVLKERQGHLRELKKERDQAIIYKDTADKVKVFKASLLHKQYNTKEKSRTKLKERSQGIQKKIGELREKASKIGNEISITKEQLNVLNKDIESKGEVEAAELQQRIEVLKVGLATNKERIQGLRETITKLSKQQQEIKETFKSSENRTQEVETEKKAKEGQRDEVALQLKAAEDKLEKFKKAKGLDSAHETEIQIEEIDKELEKLQTIVHELRETQQQTLRDKDRAEYQIQTIEQQEEAYKDMLSKHKEELASLKTQKETFKRAVKELNELLNRDSKEAGELGKIKQKVQEAKQELGALEVKQAEFRAANVDVLAKKIKEQVQGVIGTVGELGEVEGKHTIALEVAAGARLTSIVVETDSIAKNCIRFLRERKLGVATFLPLNKIKPPKIEAPPPGIKRAIDHVTYDPRYQSIFQFVLANTLVVADLEEAKKIGQGKYRMVTLQGDLLEKAGSMTGGFRRRRSAFKEKDLTGKIEKTSKDLVGLEEKEHMLEKSRAITDQRITELRQEKATLEGEIIKLEKSLHVVDEEEGKDYKQQLQDKQKELDKGLDKVKDDIDDHTTTITQHMTKRQKLREQTKQIRNPGVLAELHAFEQQKQNLQENLSKVKTELHGLEVKISEVIGVDVQKNKELLAKMQQEEKAHKEKITTLTDGIKSQEEELRTKEKEQAKANVQFKDMFAKRDKFTHDINQKERSQLMVEEESRREEMQENAISVEETRVAAEMATINETMAQYAGVELDHNKNEEVLQKLINEGERKLAGVGNVNLRSLDVYDIAEKEFTVLQDKKEVLLKEKESVTELMQDIEVNKARMFLGTFDSINEHFQRIFSELNPKGRTATLTIGSREEPFEAGMSMRVEVSQGKHLDIRSLSGGEKTMTALSFLFAIQEHDPATFYVMDEVDAALDKANSDKLAKLIHQYGESAQYIIVSHNDALINQADILYGVSMNPDAGRSNVVSLKV